MNKQLSMLCTGKTMILPNVLNFSAFARVRYQVLLPEGVFFRNLCKNLAYKNICTKNSVLESQILEFYGLEFKILNST